MKRAAIFFAVARIQLIYARVAQSVAEWLWIKIFSVVRKYIEEIFSSNYKIFIITITKVHSYTSLF